MKRLFSLAGVAPASALLIAFLVAGIPANAAPRFSAMGVADRDLFNVGWAKDNGEMEWGLMNVKGNLIMAPKHQQPLSYDNSVYSPAKREGKFGVMNHAGHNAIIYNYDNVVVNGEYAICSKGKTHEIHYMPKFKVVGKVNEEKTGIIPLKYSDELILAIDTKTNKYGYLTPNGKTVIPFQYDQAGAFNDDRAAVALNGRVFYIDHTGARAFDKDFPLPHYEAEGAPSEIRDFTKGHAAVTNDAKMVGVIDAMGNQVVPFIYNDITVFPNGTALALLENEDGIYSWDILDHNGNKIANLPHNDYNIDYDYETGYYVEEEKDDNNNTFYYFANADGRLFNGQKFDGASAFKKGNAFVRFPGEEAWSVINAYGEVVFHTISADIK